MKGKLYINFKAYAKMFHYTQAAKGEVSAWGKIRRDGDIATVTDVWLLKQNASGGSVDLDEEAVVDFIVDVAKSGKPTEDYCFWMHSHANFGVFWSGTDTDNQARHSVNSELYSLVMNKAGEMLARYDSKGLSHALDVVVLPTGHNSLMKKCYRAVARKVKSYPRLYTELEVTHEEIFKNL